MLIGEYQHSMDPKGRLFIPAKFREELGETFVISKGLDKALFVYSKEEWNKLEASIRELPAVEARKLQLFFFAGASESEPDKQGRVVIPQKLREYSGLEKDVMIIGASSHLEIWDKEKWEAETMDITPEMVEDAMKNMIIK